MFRSRASGLQFIPQDGMQVIAQGNISVYERDGQYQLYVNSMRPAGQGQLHLAFLELKEKLEREGLFAAAHKQALPFLPRVIGIATSPTGAALQDMLTVIRRRFPRAQILLAPVVVQGAEAPPSIVRALQYLGAVPEVDVIILGRGGGSIEELWAFNDERVARAIYACPKPVVSAVGHETDFTIADFVADLRAPTPSAAAEAVVPVLNELEAGLKALEQRLIGATYNLVLRKWQAAQALSARLALHHPERTISNLTQTLDSLETRMINAMNKQLTHASHQLQANASKFTGLSPLAVLARGYSIVLNRQEEVIRAADAVQVGDQLEIVLAKGRIHSQVISTGGI